jgi:hypothetical protein
MSQPGASDYIKLKLYEAVRELVGLGSISARLGRATWAIYNLHEDAIPAAQKQRFGKIRDKLAVDYQFLKESPVAITDVEGTDLAQELLAIFAAVCDPADLGIVMAARSAG